MSAMIWNLKLTKHVEDLRSATWVCTELMRDGAATDFTKNAFGHLKAIGFSKEAWPLLEKSGVESDEAVIDLKSGVDSFVEQARTRLWSREPKVRALA